MSAALKWGLSVLDWRSHLIDERAGHPDRCADRAMRPPTDGHNHPARCTNGKRCDQCIAPQQSGTIHDTTGWPRPPGPGVRVDAVAVESHISAEVMARWVALLNSPVLRRPAVVAPLAWDGKRAAGMLAMGNRLRMDQTSKRHAPRMSRKLRRIQLQPVKPLYG